MLKKHHEIKKIKHKLLDDSDNKCALCGIELTLENALLDHIKPYKKGGKTELNNLQILCNKCNKAQVFEALDNKKWEYRTVSGVSKETKIKESVVRSVMEKSNDTIRESISLSRNGNKLYTLKNRKSALADFWTSMKKLSNDKFEAGE